MILAPIIKMVRAYDATEWEIFIREWQKGVPGYHAVQRLGSGGDLGRDVIGLCSPLACQGVWDNFQCKHYEKPLDVPTACEDAGKIIFWAFKKEFTPPRRCIFVAPRGPSTALRDKLLNPDKFREEVISTWDTRVAPNMIENQKHLLAGDLEAYVRSYDFTSFGFVTLEEILDDHRKTAFWASRFGGLLPPANVGIAPDQVTTDESVYVGKLLDVYTEATGAPIRSVSELVAHQQWHQDLRTQRERFFDAEAFMATYRDQTEPGTVEDFASQIADAIAPGLSMPAPALTRLTTALTTAGATKPANVLSAQAKVRVRQGVCHQLANTSEDVTWKV